MFTLSFSSSANPFSDRGVLLIILMILPQAGTVCQRAKGVQPVDERHLATVFA
jgi:hypothetical protein